MPFIVMMDILLTCRPAQWWMILNIWLCFLGFSVNVLLMGTGYNWSLRRKPNRMNAGKKYVWTGDEWTEWLQRPKWVKMNVHRSSDHLISEEISDSDESEHSLRHFWDSSETPEETREITDMFFLWRDIWDDVDLSGSLRLLSI